MGNDFSSEKESSESETYDNNTFFPGLWSKPKLGDQILDEVERQYREILERNRRQPGFDAQSIIDLMMRDHRDETVSSEPMVLDFIVCEKHTGSINDFINPKKKVSYKVNTKMPDHDCRANCTCLNNLKGGNKKRQSMWGGADDSSSSSSSVSSSSSTTNVTDDISPVENSRIISSDEEHGMILSNSSVNTSDLDRMHKNLFNKDLSIPDIDDFDSEDVYRAIDGIENKDISLFSTEDNEILALNSSSAQYMNKTNKKNMKYR